MMKTKSLVAILVFGCAMAAPARAGNWPRFQGPNGSGTADDKNVPVRFDEKSGILWKVRIPGQGNSSPIVWGDRLFLQTGSADGKHRSLMCLDAATGKILWMQPWPGKQAKKHPKNTFASSTPATDGKIVVTAFWDGQDISLVAFDFQGKQIWSQNLGPFVSQHGAGASPIIYKDKVFFTDDQDGTSTLFALNKNTGEIVWRAAREAYRACYSSPFIREEPGAPPELIVVSTTSIRSYEPDTGTVNWNWAWKFTARMPLRTTASPIFAHETVYACSGDGGGDRHMVAVKLTKNGRGTQPEKAWENKKDFPYVPTLLSRGDYLYFVNDRGMAGCYEAATGKRVWQERLSSGAFTASPVMIDGKVYAPSEDGEVFVFAAEPSYQLLAHNSVGEQVRASPAVANNRLYLRGQEHLYCIANK
jgi:outer membrane protein assembly factor BamB